MISQNPGRNESFLLAAVGFGCDSDKEITGVFDAAPGLHYSVRTDCMSAHFAFSPAVTRAERSGPLLLLLQGEIYDEPEPTFASRLLKAYESRADVAEIFRRLHGSYVCLVADGVRGSILVVSDHVNSRKLFWSRRGPWYWISSLQAFDLHPVDAADLDPAGLASALVNGIPVNGRTLFRSVHATQRSTIHTLDSQGWRADQYWDYAFVPQRRSERSMRDDLIQLVLAAVRRRTRSDESLFVSLSGGYDSTTLIGALAENGVRDATCLSYTKLGGKREPDALVARETARMAGYSHRVITGFGLPISDVLDGNVAWGRGHARLVVEADAWREMDRMLGSARKPCMFVGDGCLGCYSAELGSSKDALQAMGLADWSSVGWPGSKLSPRTNRMLGDALQSDLDDVVARAPAGEGYQDLRDWLHLDQRLPRTLAWREAFAGRAAPVRQPLLDWEILEFIQTVPSDLRKDKRLFREAVSDRFPLLFASDRPPGGWQVRPWARMVVQRERKRLECLLATGPSPLDDWVPPNFLRDLITRQQRFPVVAASGRFVRRVRNRLGQAVKSGTDRSPRTHAKLVDDSVFLLRALYIRLFLQSRSRTADRASEATILGADPTASHAPITG